MSSKESKIYLVLLALAYVTLNVGLFIFSAHRGITNFGPYKGSIDPLYFTGMIVHTLGSLATIVFIGFRLKGKLNGRVSAPPKDSYGYH